MPTYGYECLSCANQIEVFQSIKDAPLTTCDSCGGTLRKRIYPVGIAFKGAGFYVNDYASKPATKSETTPEAGSTPEAKPDGQAETPKAEAKPSEPAAPAASA